jgi:hypothetical protein
MMAATREGMIRIMALVLVISAQRIVGKQEVIRKLVGSDGLK